MPREVLDQIIARTDGVPLFIEELTKAVIDGGWLQRENGRYVLAGPVPQAAIPTTLHASLVARLDRVAPVKDVAQIGAAIGREFSFELVASVTGLSDRVLAQALEQLVSAELIYRRGTPPNAIYTFKHALVQDAAYSTLLRGRRQELHAQIAKVLEARFADIVEAQPEVLAHHYTEAGLALPAIAYWKKAGERAAKRSANLEAIAHFRRGLEMIEALPDRADHAGEELEPADGARTGADDDPIHGRARSQRNLCASAAIGAKGRPVRRALSHRLGIVFGGLHRRTFQCGVSICRRSVPDRQRPG